MATCGESSHYQARKLLVAAGIWVKQLLPVTPVRKEFSWHQGNGRFSENNHSRPPPPPTTGGSHYYGFTKLENALKVGKHDGDQRITAPEQCKPFTATSPFVRKRPALFLRRVVLRQR